MTRRASSSGSTASPASDRNRSHPAAARDAPDSAGWSYLWRRAAIKGLLLASGSEIPSCLKLFRDLERASPEVVAEYQRRQLLRLLRHCLVHVPYYRRRIEPCNLDLSDAFTASEISKLPLLTKETIRQQGPNLHCDDLRTRGVFENASGGSTGKPITFLQDRAYHARSVVAAKFIYNEHLGKKAGELEMNLWGSERDILRGSLGLKKRAIKFLYNRRFQNYFLVDDDKLARFVDEINRYQPVSMWAYVQSLDLLAKFIRRNRLKVHSPRLIIATAGTLHDGVRQSVQDVFGCPVYNQYGCREVGTIAFEMQDQDGLRGLPYLNYTEVVDGNVVVTNLTNYSMPLLRYEIGDTAEAWTGVQDSQYGCRRKILQEVTGRVHSHFRTADGGLVYGGFFATQFFFVDWVRQFQIVQDSIDHITCNLALADEPIEADMDVIRDSIRRVMGPACDVEFKFTDNIAPTPSGKHMYTISKVQE